MTLINLVYSNMLMASLITIILFVLSHVIKPIKTMYAGKRLYLLYLSLVVALTIISLMGG